MTATYANMFFQKLTPSERIHLILFPEQAVVIKRSAENALRQSKLRFRGSGRNTASDAFRHCFLSALLARDIGYASALRYTNAHEAFAGNPPAEKVMDLHNNAVGLRIGRLGGGDALLISKCISALRSGKLKIIQH